MSIVRDPQWEVLGETWGMLGEDERKVLVELANRLLIGQHRYRKLDLANDPRDWMKERKEELEDYIMYAAFEYVKRSMG